MLLNSFVVSSQTFEFYYKNGTPFNVGDTLKVDSLPSVSEMIGSLNVKNISGQDVSVYCDKEIINEMSGTTNTYCWGLCFPPTTFTSPDPILIPAGQISEGFSGHYYPTNIEGITLIKYTFKIIHGDEAFVFIKFKASYTGVEENKYSVSVSAPYPNPANAETHINYNIPSGSKAILQVYNICGKIEKQFAINKNNGMIDINVLDLPSGIYLCSLNVNGRIIRTSRLIVNH